MEKDGDSEEEVVKRRFEGRGQKGRSDKGKYGGEKYTEKVIRKMMEKEGERQ